MAMPFKYIVLRPNRDSRNHERIVPTTIKRLVVIFDQGSVDKGLSLWEGQERGIPGSDDQCHLTYHLQAIPVPPTAIPYDLSVGIPACSKK